MAQASSASSEEVDIISSIDNLTISDGEKEDMKEWIRQNNKKHIEMLITGRTGVGKSTLVNGLVGREVAKEGRSLKAETMSVTGYEIKTTDGFEIIVWDSPGLQDGSADEAKYLAEMKKKCSNVDMVIYCIKVADPRSKLSGGSVAQTDFSAIGHLTATFGPEWWMHAIFVLTFGNALEASLKARDPQKLVENFEDRIKSWKMRIHEALISAGVPEKISRKIPVIPAGHANKPHLPGTNYWFSEFWFMVIMHTKEQSAIALLQLNQARLKKPEEVKQTDFTTKAIHQQPIVVDDAKYKMALGGAGVGMTIGAVVGGVLGGGVPGALIGGAVGGAIGSATGLTVGIITNLWRRRKIRKMNKAGRKF